MCHDCKKKKSAPPKKASSKAAKATTTDVSAAQSKKQAAKSQTAEAAGSHSCADVDDTSGDNGTNPGGLIMIDTTKTAN